MAGLNVNVISGSVNTGTSVKTVLQYRAHANAGARVKKVRWDPNGITPTDPKVLVELVKGSTAATGSGSSSASVLKVDGHTGSVLGSATKDYGGGNPTGGTVIYSSLCHKQNFFTYDREIVLNPAESLEIRVTSGTDIASYASMLVEE